MKVNLKSFSVRRSVSQDGRQRLGFIIGFTDYEGGDRSISPMLHCEQHIEEFTQRLRGGAGYMSAHVFEDGLYYLQPHTSGIRFLVSQSGMTKQRYVKDESSLTGYKYRTEQVTRGFETVELRFPGEKLAEWIDKTRLSYKVKDLSKGVKFEVDEAEATRLRYKYRERAKIVFPNYLMVDVRERFVKAIHGPAAESFRNNCVLPTYRGTRNMSMGNLMHLEVHPDGKESFMFIRRNMERLDEYGKGVFCGNGGWILHHNSDGSAVEFTTHT